MEMMENIDTLFLDLGGVLLTGGWDRNSRQKAVREFSLEKDEVQERHQLLFEGFEKGKFNLDEYLKWVIFFRERPFSKNDFRHFMFDQSRALPGMIPMIRKIKHYYGLKTVVISNESRTLAEYRIRKFKLAEFVDLFVFSCFVQSRKPETDIYRIALDVSQADPRHVAYLDDREIFVEVARSLGIEGILHTGYESTRKALANLGLSMPGRDETATNECG